MKFFTITNRLSGEFRPMIDFGGSFRCYCHFEYAVTPSAEKDSIEIEGLRGDDDVTSEWLPSLKEGIERFMGEKEAAGIKFQRIRIEIRMLKTHPIDTSHRCVEHSAFWFMRDRVEPCCEEMMHFAEDAP